MTDEMGEAPYAIGIDLGATKIASALIDRNGAIAASDQVATGAQEGVSAVCDRIAGQIHSLLQQAPGPVQGVGVGTAGVVDPSVGVVRQSVNLKWENVNFSTEIAKRLRVDLPLFLENDANASTLGEWWFGAGKGCKDLVYLSIGSGLGGGAVVAGKLLVGSECYGMGIGHLSLDPNGLLCTCGRRGCVETILSGRGLLAIYGRLAKTDPYRSQPLDPDAITTYAVVQKAQSGDPLALATFAQMGRVLGQVIAMVTSVLNPAKIVVGGGLGQAAYGWMMPQAIAECETRLISHSRKNLEYLKSPQRSSAIGAASLVWYKRLSNEGVIS